MESSRKVIIKRARSAPQLPSSPSAKFRPRGGRSHEDEDAMASSIGMTLEAADAKIKD